MDDTQTRKPLIARDSLAAAVAIALASLIAWWWLATSHTGMDASAIAMPAKGWTPAYALSVFVMWTIMMLAMMLPSAAPMILLHARAAQGRGAATLAFAGAYLAVWTGFSLGATAAQWLLTESGALGETMQLHDRTFAAALLAAAGLYQLTPLKRICLSQCRAPLSYLMQNWRPHVSGAIRMGLAHGAYCVGCCWFVMALLFVGGVMNLGWVVALAAFVMAERLLPFGERVGQVAGVAALAAALYIIAMTALG